MVGYRRGCHLRRSSSANSSVYCSRWRSPRNSPTAARAPGRPAARRSAGREEARNGRAERGEVVGSSIRRPCLAVHDLVQDPADGAGDDRLRFHIASATVRPKPSARLFWTTTVAWRWSALTMRRSRRGRASARTRGGRGRARRAEACARASMHSSSTARALRVVGDAVTAGPASTRWRRATRRRARRTPA